jgi:two-component system CheB/CheR fusion protein
LFEEKGIGLITDTGDEPLYIKADPVRIAQIIGNLLHNAYKFTEKDGKVVLSVYRQNSDAVIVIHDTGIGIDTSFLDGLFKTFWQAKQNKGGLGLGLSIVKGFVELHGGTVNAKSDGLNRGSEFTVRLPLADEPPKPENCETKIENYRTKPLKILMIDDNCDLAEITCSLLTHCGYEAAAEYSGLSGIQKARELMPHVILCDIGLPDIDGYEVARRISHIKELDNTRLISLSGYAQTSDFEYSKHAGFDLHISKPIDIEDLKDQIESIIQAH